MPGAVVVVASAPPSPSPSVVSTIAPSEPGSDSESEQDVPEVLEAVSLEGNDKRKAVPGDDDYINWPQVLLADFMLLAEVINLASILPWVGFYVEHLGVASTESEVAIYAGILGGVFGFGQFLSGVQWGKVSGVIGNRGALVLGLGLCAIPMLLLGLTNSYAFAVLLRFLSGVLNGNIAIVKTQLAALSTQKTAAKVFSTMGFTFAIGYVIAPSAGGALADVGEPKEFPFLLACAFPALYNAVAALLCYYKMEETNHGYLTKKAAKAGIVAAGFAKEVEMEEGVKSPHGLVDISSGDQAHLKMAGLDEVVARAEAPALALGAPLDQGEMASLASTKKKEAEGSVSSAFPVVEKEKVPRFGGINFMDPSIIKVLCYFGILNYAHVFNDEGFPLWAMKSYDDEGLGFSSTTIGIVLAAGGAGQIFNFIYPWTTKKLGLKNTAILGCVVVSSIFFFIPFSRYMAEAWRVPVLGVFNAFRFAGSICVFTTSQLMCNNVVPPSKLGYFNGVAQSVRAALYALGPLSAGLFVAVSVGHGYPFPVNFHLPFIVPALAIAICGIIVVTIPSSIEKSCHSEGSMGRAAKSPTATKV